MEQSQFEQWLWDQDTTEMSHYHDDNGIFAYDAYCCNCEGMEQTQSFSGVGAQHQNTWVDRAIQTIMYMACTFMVHSALHWTD